MKRLLSLLMILLMCLLAVSCGGGSTSDAPDPDSEEARQEAEEQKELLEAFGPQEFPSSVGPFTAVDLDGNEVTEDYFSKADVTIVHLWGTYCDPCLEEMENLGKMAESLPDNAQVLGIVVDASSPDDEEYELAKKIISDNNVKFTSVVASPSFTDLMNSISGVPTTFIVDSEGNVAGEPIVGSDVLGYKDLALNYLRENGL